MVKKSPLQGRLEYFAARLMLGFFGVLPRRVATGVGLLVARFGYLVLGRLRKVGTRNLEIAFPEMEPSERTRILKGAFDNLGRMLGEVSQFPRATPKKLEELVLFDFDPEEQARFDAERARGRGVILAGPHLGNWEIGVFAYSAIREPLNYLARPIDNPQVEDLIAGIRSRFGNRAINKSNSVSTAMALLRSGGVLGVLPDVNVQEKDGVFVPFFGIPACTTGGVAILAKRTGAMIVPLCTVWDAKIGKYRVKHGKIIDAATTDDRHKDVIETTTALTAAMEEFVRSYPEQWLWIHKRWNTRPAGEPSLY
ncbi:MAG: lysophospholipid acyltransferase family protein [Acidobacteriota bacterium]